MCHIYHFVYVRRTFYDSEKANVLFQPSTISCFTVGQKNEEDKPSHGEYSYITVIDEFITIIIFLFVCFLFKFYLKCKQIFCVTEKEIVYKAAETCFFFKSAVWEDTLVTELDWCLFRTLVKIPSFHIFSPTWAIKNNNCIS